MAAPEYPRDYIPDMTIPERTTPKTEPSYPLAPQDLGSQHLVRRDQGPWRDGDRVLAPWTPGRLFVGRIVERKEGQALIEFDDGDAGWVHQDQLRPVAFTVGQEVLCRRDTGLSYFLSTILEVDGDNVCVAYSDGVEPEWRSLADLCVLGPASGSGAEPTRVASHLAFFQNLREGDRVWAPWQGGTLFAGTVDEILDNEVHIHFDDGDRGWVLLEQLAPLSIPIGLRVMGRWRMGNAYYPGTVAEVRGEQICIHYDDGDREWTKPGALAIPAQVGGPDARATKVTTGSAGLIPRGLIVVVFIVIYLLFRAGCR